MSTAGRTASEDAPAASDVAATLRDAEFVRFVARADGDSLAASGVLARACSDLDIPFQTSATRLPERRADARDDEVVVTVGAAGGAVSLVGRTASVTAFDVATELGVSPDPTLALAGVVAAGGVPGADDSARLFDAAEGRFARRPGVGVPTEDLADGLAHSTLLHAAFSGRKGAVQAELAELGLPVELDESAYRRVASLVALSVVESEAATARAAETVERALRPCELVDGPFATLAGYADVLDAVARERPGTGVALALGHDVRSPALDAWRDHASAAHAALREATTGRYDGLFVARTDAAPVETTARLLRDFRSPEPVTLVVTDGEAAAAAVEDCDLGSVMAEAVAELGGYSDGETDDEDAPNDDAGEAAGSERRGYARFDAETEEFLTTFREAL